MKASISSRRNQVYLSAVNFWEIAIKKSLGKVSAPTNLEDFYIQSGFYHLPITIKHATAIEWLPQYHKDPFDRMLIVQAQIEGLVLVTDDKKILAYNVETMSPLSQG